MSFFEEISPEMDRYLENHCSQEPDLLKRLRKETFQKTTQPHMISGYQQGRLLSIISRLKQPKRVLEIGTFTGYAALCLAEGMAKEGKLITLDINEELSYLPKKYFDLVWTCENPIYIDGNMKMCDECEPCKRTIACNIYDKFTKSFIIEEIL